MKQASRPQDHDYITELLPWFVNETLDEQERLLVEDHLRTCVSCRTDIELLSHLQQSVQRDSPLPLVPSARVETLLDAIDGSGVATARQISWPAIAAAASIVAIGIFAVWFVGDRANNATEIQEFETVISPSASEDFDFVIELRLTAGVGEATRNALFTELGINDPPVATSQETYRVTIGSNAMSLGALESYIDAIESRPEVSAARVVAVQLPVE